MESLIGNLKYYKMTQMKEKYIIQRRTAIVNGKKMRVIEIILNIYESLDEKLKSL